VQDEGPEILEDQDAVGPEAVADRALEERVRRDGEVARDPASEEERARRSDVPLLSQPALSENQQRQESRLQQESQDDLYCEGVGDDVDGEARKLRPVRAEMEFHRNPRNHADGEVDPEDADPEPRGVVPALPPGPEPQGFHHHDQQGQPHRQDREEVVVDDGERELEAMEKERIAQAWTSHPAVDGSVSPQIYSGWLRFRTGIAMSPAPQ